MNEKEVDLNTYVIDICNKHTYHGIRLILSRTAARELFKYKLTLKDCERILDEGYESPRKRDKCTVENWLDLGNKTYNLVIVKDVNYSFKENVWVIIHLGRFNRRKIK